MVFSEMLKRREWKEKRTNVVSSVRAVFVNEFGIYVVPIGRLVVQKPVLSLPIGEIMQALEDSYVGTVVLFAGGLVHAVDTTIEVFGKIAQYLDFDSWETLLEGARDQVAARTNCMSMALSESRLVSLKRKWDVPSPPHETRSVLFSCKAD